MADVATMTATAEQVYAELPELKTAGPLPPKSLKPKFVKKLLKEGEILVEEGLSVPSQFTVRQYAGGMEIAERQLRPLGEGSEYFTIRRYDLTGQPKKDKVWDKDSSVTPEGNLNPEFAEYVVDRGIISVTVSRTKDNVPDETILYTLREEEGRRFINAEPMTHYKNPPAQTIKGRETRYGLDGKRM